MTMACSCAKVPFVQHVVLMSLIVSTYCAATRNWKTIYMDEEDLCNDVVHNDDMEKGDIYRVESDGWHGRSPLDRRPAECWSAFNFGVRFVAVTIKEWRCDRANLEPFLAVYDNCEGERSTLLGQLNCSLTKPQTIYSSSACLSLYHYRGHIKGGYFFSLEVIALHEIIAFPVGGIAAFIVMLIVAMMVLAKVVCVISGYEARLPELNLEPGEEKRIVDNATSMDAKTMDMHIAETSNMGCTLNNTEAQALSVPRTSDHEVVGLSRSSADSITSSEIDYDFLDIPISSRTPPRLKRYPSAKASSIWGH